MKVFGLVSLYLALIFDCLCANINVEQHRQFLFCWNHLHCSRCPWAPFQLVNVEQQQPIESWRVRISRQGNWQCCKAVHGALWFFTSSTCAEVPSGSFLSNNDGFRRVKSYCDDFYSPFSCKGCTGAVSSTACSMFNEQPVQVEQHF